MYEPSGWRPVAIADRHTGVSDGNDDAQSG
jgi:hypothetical protein